MPISVTDHLRITLSLEGRALLILAYRSTSFHGYLLYRALYYMVASTKQQESGKSYFVAEKAKAQGCGTIYPRSQNRWRNWNLNQISESKAQSPSSSKRLLQSNKQEGQIEVNSICISKYFKCEYWSKWTKKVASPLMHIGLQIKKYSYINTTYEDSLSRHFFPCKDTSEIKIAVKVKMQFDE